MTDYDFSVLSPIEFEDFTKDILETELGIKLEAFAEGRDGGIDLRYANGNKNQIIVQCKRYKNVSSLISHLREEANKVSTLKPSRYILSTSLPLSVEKKEEVRRIFNPYIKSTSDIFDSVMLNSALSHNSAIEKKHYKLWISSTGVMKTILNAQVYTHASLVQKEIEDTLKIYTPTPSFDEALRILNNNHVLVIAGLPGVGKTTLAQMLTYKLLGDGSFDELVALSGDIHEALNVYEQDTNKKQLFLFDDFLGTNLLKQALPQNADTMLARLVKHIKASPNKALILTTREYILRQAKQDYDLLGKEQFIKSEYIIDVSKYDDTTKARILYNHLANSDIGPAHLSEFIKNKIYRKIINHDNYSPRLIETINSEQLWTQLSPADFCSKVIEYFDSPSKIYNDVYENKISDLAQSILVVLMSFAKRVSLSILQEAVIAYDNGTDESKINKALDELEGTFVITDKAASSNQIDIDFMNPSILDFLINKIKDMHSVQERVINSAVYLDQLTGVFSLRDNPPEVFHEEVKEITLKDNLAETFVNKVVRDFDKLNLIEIPLIGDMVINDDAFNRVGSLVTGAHIDNDNKALNKILSKVLLKHLATTRNIRPIAEALEVFSLYLGTVKPNAPEYKNFVESIANSIISIDDLEQLDKLDKTNDELYKHIHDAVAKNPEGVYEAIKDEIEGVDISELENIESIGEDLSYYIDTYRLDEDFISECIYDKTDRAYEPDPSDFYDYHDFDGLPPPNPAYSEDRYIDDIFKSLK